MSTIDEIKKIRLEKLKKIKEAGLNPYPALTKRTHTISQLLADFTRHQKAKKLLILAGRIMSQRGHGGALFLDIFDGSGKIQALLRKDKVGERGFKFFQDVSDIGDFIELKGFLFKTKTNEKTLEVVAFKMLAKTFLPLPEKWHGLQNEEERLRKRYLDILFNPEVKAMVGKRAIFWQAMREFMQKNGFLEVETPVLETTAGGADARPFITHHNILDTNLYLRISMGELWQKRLMVAGFEKTFEIGRQFRNEGMDAEHLQDYTQMEFYWAYADYNDCMKLAEELFKYVAKKTFGTLKFKIGEFDVNLAAKWQKYDYQETIQKFTKVNIREAILPEIENALQKLDIQYDKKGFNKTRAIDNLWKFCRRKIAGPGFLINEPVEISPLAKRTEKNPAIAERFHIILAGSELANGYSELNDPLDQAQRFSEQEKLRDVGDEEAQMYDKDFIEAMEYGMPPTTGFGVSERLFAFLMNKPMRECQIFPLMKPKEK
ncbi:lysine--tRNA ligase [bacterium (Candidatus Gribaldobacteria) CG08_land_8_20_14_0_20_39_15]|uniref:Lysine--tRNA ligase n=1 Tax=bacterium (Candidatus Gribaldobacteria) CG08_land_8_20_14_0_20_39_15 TaxID=2014273 RepID=A0A2M6XU20_9BACT|nr:MAG: lysine--tRNA ligase [bacterium (Candidatus Gribaldobacteria) CG08_land_8_20_14_0_20_39_15]